MVSSREPRASSKVLFASSMVRHVASMVVLVSTRVSHTFGRVVLVFNRASCASSKDSAVCLKVRVASLRTMLVQRRVSNVSNEDRRWSSGKAEGAIAFVEAGPWDTG